MIVAKTKAWLSHPLTRGLDLDSPSTTDLRRRIIRSKPFLRRIYVEWYGAIARALPEDIRPVLEIGSGAGFLDEFVPNLITSDILACRNVDVVLDAAHLPFAGGSLRSIVMTNVLHHLASPRHFFTEAARCVRPGGVLVMIEPWNSTWSRFVYTHLHHEHFEPHAKQWELPRGAPLSSANGALPWMLFERDRALFEDQFPDWQVAAIRLGMPFRYLLSGGMSLRSLMPVATFPLWRGLEQLLQPWMRTWAMFAEITLGRRHAPPNTAVQPVRH
jgi:SAM-dependent methyltransferase